jgi:class 3 adenylate cyclase
LADLPTGTVTLLFSDVDGSTELVKRLGERNGEVLADHRTLLRHAFAEHRGVEIDTQGDAFFVAFGSARDAVAAAIAGQRALAVHAWPEGVELRVRMGLHTCEPHRAGEGYVGVGVHRAARICTIAHGGQVLLSRSTAGIVDDGEIPGGSVRDLGEHPLKDLDRPERVFELAVEGLPAGFPPLRTLDQQTPLAGTVTIVDTATAAFPTARQAALAAVAAKRAVAGHEWPPGPTPQISVGIHAGEAGVGWVGPAVVRCETLCDSAEAGQIFLSQAASALLEDEDLGDLAVRDLGEQRARRSGEVVHAYELVVPAAAGV